VRGCGTGQPLGWAPGLGITPVRWPPRSTMAARRLLPHCRPGRLPSFCRAHRRTDAPARLPAAAAIPGRRQDRSTMNVTMMAAGSARRAVPAAVLPWTRRARP
jgi:hypothetical protein